MTNARMPRTAALSLAMTMVAVSLAGCIGSIASPPPEPDPAWDDSVTYLLAAEHIDAVARVEVATGWPYVQFADLDAFAAGFTTVTQLEPFRAGGSYSIAESDRLTIVHVPDRSSEHFLAEIIAIAIAYPDAEVLLQATTAGPQWPALFIARLTPDQATEIAARLRDPELADADREGYPVDFVLTTIGPDGPEYTNGTLGDVPEG